jgi:hypothetical protein
VQPGLGANGETFVHGVRCRGVLGLVPAGEGSLDPLHLGDVGGFDGSLDLQGGGACLDLLLDPLKERVVAGGGRGFGGRVLRWRGTRRVHVQIPLL